MHRSSIVHARINGMRGPLQKIVEMPVRRSAQQPRQPCGLAACR
jgi:hypothetical protein